MSAPLLSVQDLTVKKDNDSPLLSSLSFDLPDGEILVLRGPSGSGKSTLLKCIAELNIYSSGTIKYRGQSIREIRGGAPEWRVRVGYVPQRPSLLPGTPLDFVNTINSFSARRNNKLAKSQPLDQQETTPGSAVDDPLDLAQEWGIEKPLWRRDWGTLSGGEAQRIALAVAVAAGGADVLLLDEPTSALDEENSKKVEKTLISMLPSHKGNSTPSPTPSEAQVSKEDTSGLSST
ncbi:ATP-binding cassette transporter [Kwoniella heveanensis CBS 569]|nr:ATP-binding cassette transporter [Kwoniella heveanensis CBS 569]